MTFIGVIIKSKSADTAGVGQSSIAMCTAPPKRGDIVERVLLNYPLCGPLHHPQKLEDDSPKLTLYDRQGNKGWHYQVRGTRNWVE